jgi:hypothetical protein
MIGDLVGLKWRDNELDCVKLMIMAQRELWGREIQASQEYFYSREEIKEVSMNIIEEMERIAYRVERPQEGDVAVLNIHGGLHVATFVSDMEILHIFEGHTSRIARYSRPFIKRTVAIYRFREVRKW